MNWKKVMLALVLIDVALMAGIWGVAKLTPSTSSTQAISDEAQFLFNNLRAEQLRRQVANKSQFTPPADGRLTADQVRLAIEVWRTVDPALSRAHDSLWSGHRKRWPMDRRPETAVSRAARREVARRNLAINLQAMPGQVAVLNRHQVSLAEYLWLKQRVIEAFGREAEEGIAKLVSEGRARIAGPPENTATVLATGKPATGALGANVSLVSRYDLKTDWLQGSSVGF